jgi:methyl-accepting chemotaxis protein
VAAEAEKTYTDTRNIMIGISVAILAFAAAMAYWITISITRPVTEALKIATTVANGDLTKPDRGQDD